MTMRFDVETVRESGFYSGKDWIEVRDFVRKRDKGKCRICGAVGAERYEVDHIIELNWGNVQDPDIALNPENCQLLCHDCHTKKTRRDKQGKGRLFF